MDKMILNEDIFDDAIIVVEDETDTLPGPTTPQENGVASLLLNAINDEIDTIDKYNVVLANIQTYPEFILVIQDILNEENNHVGMLQELLKKVSPNAENISDGEEEAKEILSMNESLKEAYIDAPKDVLNIIRSDKEYNTNAHVRTYVPDFSSIPDGTVITLKGLNKYHPEVYATIEKISDNNWNYTYIYGDGSWNKKLDNYGVMREIYEVDNGMYESLQEEVKMNESSATKKSDLEFLAKKALDAVTAEELNSVISPLAEYDRKKWLHYSQMIQDGEYSIPAIGKMISDDLYWEIHDSNNDLIVKESLNESVETPYFKAFITNLGKYNEGELVGEWVEFPIDEDEFEEVLQRIGINDYYEEWFVTDYDCNLGAFNWSELGEYPNYDELNDFGEMVESIDDIEAVDNALEVNSNLTEVIEGLRDGSITFVPDIKTNEDLGYYYIDIMGEITPDLAREYFNYAALGRDISFDSYQDDDGNYISAEEYWCGDEDASDEEIGEAFVAEVGMHGVPNLGHYFDYEGYGWDIVMENNITFTTDGIIIEE